MAEQDVSFPAEPSVAAADHAPACSELTRLGAVILGLGLVLGALNNQAVRLSDQVLPELPAPGLLAARVLVDVVGAGLLSCVSGGSGSARPGFGCGLWDAGDMQPGARRRPVRKG